MKLQELQEKLLTKNIIKYDDISQIIYKICIYDSVTNDERIGVSATNAEDLIDVAKDTINEIMEKTSLFITETLAKCEDIDLVIYDGYDQVSGRYEFRVESIIL
ncbi:hypothetical protein LCGC14_0176310 [marine sediment metagenome]|uniref:Uncharacterized protein n=1 Tax=marine sediment metagenome TaxID=412755 RepID=A0A0F9V7U5_9ZZZZ